MRRMLDPKEAGGSLPSTITFDENGNRKVGKDLGVDGKLKLKSLVSATNPDGDITKELGGGGGAKIYRHSINISQNEKLRAYITYYTTSETAFSMSTLKNIFPDGSVYECSGYYAGTSGHGPIICIKGHTNFQSLNFADISTSALSIRSINLDDSQFSLVDKVSAVN